MVSPAVKGQRASERREGDYFESTGTDTRDVGTRMDGRTVSQAVQKELSDMIQILFYKRLRELREEFGLSIPDLARIVHVEPNTVTHWENDHCRTSYDTLALLAEIFHTTTDYLIGVSDERNRR